MNAHTERRPPLDGLRVLDLSHYLSAPTCAMVLADMGADVVKIESPHRGDDLRRLGPKLGHATAQFEWANRNKWGLGVDLKTEAGRIIVQRLAGTADVLVENFASGVLPRLGLGAADLCSVNPRLVYCSISGYSREGALADRPGFDPVVQAEAGIMSITGHADREGVRTGPAVADMSAGFHAVSSILAALLERERSGAGQSIEVSLYDTAVSLAGAALFSFLASGKVPQRAGNASREGAPTDVYRASDGAMYIACPSDALFSRLATNVLGRPEWLTDPRFRTNADRMTHAAALREAIEARLGERSCTEWQLSMRAAQIPAGVINDMSQVVASPEMAERGLLTQVPHPAGGHVPSLRLPYRFSRSTHAEPRPAPGRGEHTDQVLRRMLDCSDGELARWRKEGAFGTP